VQKKPKIFAKKPFCFELPIGQYEEQNCISQQGSIRVNRPENKPTTMAKLKPQIVNQNRCYFSSARGFQIWEKYGNIRLNIKGIN
jgi:hypothetical protein